jgi:ribosomal protein S19
MSRSKWKIPFFEKNLFQSLISKQSLQPVRVAREMQILSGWASKTVFIYNGKSFFKLKITQKMVGHSFGEFAAPTTSAKYLEKKEKRKHLKQRLSIIQ